MIGLRGTRVVVVDDEVPEALPILKAMAKAGIASAYFEGKASDAPPFDQRLVGVRLAILDMDIVGARVDEKSKVAALVGFLERILSPSNGPYAVILWTKHNELRQLFEDAVGRSSDLPRPVFVAMIEKRDFLGGGTDFDLDGFSSRLDAELRAASPLAFYQQWEGVAAAAAADVTNQLSTLASPNTGALPAYQGAWKSNMLSVMHAIARASAEQHLALNTCIDAIAAALNPFHADRMEQRSGEVSTGLDWVAAEVLAAPHDCGHDARARLNGMLHVGLPIGNTLAPGGVYSAPEATMEQLGVNVISLLDDLVRTTANAGERQGWIDEIRGTSRFIVVEISATCDHAQKNIRAARCTAGLLVPAHTFNRIKASGQFFLQFGPIFLGAAGIAPSLYHLVLSARHPATFQSTAAADLSALNLTGIGRLRGQALTSLQAWLNTQATRPGLLFLRS